MLVLCSVLRLNDDAGFADQVLDHAKQHEEQQLQNFDEDLEQGSDTRILTLQELKEFARTVFDKGACPISSSRMLAVALLSSQMCLRGGDDIPHLRFSAMEVLDAIPAITPTPALPLAIAMVGGKTQGAAAAKTKLGKADRVTYCSLLRHWDPLLDAVGALALYLALHWEPHAHMLLLGTKKEVGLPTVAATAAATCLYQLLLRRLLQPAFPELLWATPCCRFSG